MTSCKRTKHRQQQQKENQKNNRQKKKKAPRSERPLHCLSPLCIPTTIFDLPALHLLRSIVLSGFSNDGTKNQLGTCASNEANKNHERRISACHPASELNSCLPSWLVVTCLFLSFLLSCLRLASFLLIQSQTIPIAHHTMMPSSFFFLSFLLVVLDLQHTIPSCKPNAFTGCHTTQETKQRKKKETHKPRKERRTARAGEIQGRIERTS